MERKERNKPTLITGFADPDDPPEMVRQALLGQIVEQTPDDAPYFHNATIESMVAWLDQRAPDGWYFDVGGPFDEYGYWPCDDL